MSSRDLALGVGLVARVLSGLNLRDGVKVITGDVGAMTCAQVFDASKIDLQGGGGTDMGAIIQQADEDQDLGLIVCVTDGDTPWPSQPTKAGLVVCLTDDRWRSSVPSWADCVVLNP
jgi:hypothetical protein